MMDKELHNLRLENSEILLHGMILILNISIISLTNGLSNLRLWILRLNIHVYVKPVSMKEQLLFFKSFGISVKLLQWVSTTLIFCYPQYSMPLYGFSKLRQANFLNILQTCSLYINRYDCGVFMLKYTDFYSRGLGLCFSQVSNLILNVNQCMLKLYSWNHLVWAYQATLCLCWWLK